TAHYGLQLCFQGGSGDGNARRRFEGQHPHTEYSASRIARTKTMVVGGSLLRPGLWNVEADDAVIVLDSSEAIAVHRDKSTLCATARGPNFSTADDHALFGVKVCGHFVPFWPGAELLWSPLALEE